MRGLLVSILSVLALAGVSTAAWALKCDVDNNGRIDRADISLIQQAVVARAPVSGPDDPRDADSNGVINSIDSRLCVLRCKYPSCATNGAPLADAGPDQTVRVAERVQLNGAASADPDGNALVYSWSFVSRPAGSTAALSNPGAVNPSFVADRPGNYEVQLVVGDGSLNSAPDRVTISTVNSAPVANAGPDQSARVGDVVVLDGRASSDVDGDPLGYAWRIVSAPGGSSAALLDATSVQPRITLDAAGTYVFELIVSDAGSSSAPDTVQVSTVNTAPVARPGANRAVALGALVPLDGSASSDVDGHALTYAWSLLSRPAGSTAVLSNAGVVNPSFSADLPGSYVAQLIVNDGFVDSAPASVTITTENAAPRANAGPDQTVPLGAPVQLDGSASSDPEGTALTYAWSITSRPAGSSATLSAANLVNPGFTADRPGTYVLQLIVNDGVLASAPDSVVISTANSRPLADAGAAQNVATGATVQLDGSASRDADGDALTYAWSLTTRPAGSTAVLGNPGVVNPSFVADQAGSYVAQLIVSDGTLASVPVTVMVTATTPNRPPAAVAAATPGSVNVGQTVNLSSTGSSDPDGTPLSYTWSLALRPAGSVATVNNANAASASFVPDVAGSYTVLLSVSDGSLGAEATASVTANAVAVIRPSSIDASVATSVFGSTAFLYADANPVQTGVTEGTIDARRVAVVRGKLFDRAGQPVAGVAVTVLNHSQYGQTVSRADGQYDMAVNGGGSLTLVFSKAGYLSVQRSWMPKWQAYAVLDDVVLTLLDGAANRITLNGAGTLQVARSSSVTDSSGTRRATVMFPAGTTATKTLADGRSVPLTSLTVRATEYTVGSGGPRAMPGALPPTSGYTYAVELSADEAADAFEVRFSQPVTFYVENFLNFRVGMAVPVGYYDRQRAVWVPSANGRVVKVIGIAGGRAQVDTNGDGQADNTGISDAEAQALASLYPAGATLWRVLMDHFTPWDCNWPYGPPPGAGPPPGPRPGGRPCGGPNLGGSIIDCEAQSLGEELAIVGAPFSLRYQSSSMPGVGHVLDVPLSGPTLPPGVTRMDVVVTVAGQVLKQSQDAAVNARQTLTWDGSDAYGRTVNGAQSATVRVGYVYPAVYYEPADLPAAFAAAGAGPISGNPARGDVTLWREYQVPLGTVARNAANVGGWQPSIVHSADPVSGEVNLGTGGRLLGSSSGRQPLLARTLAGTGESAYNGDGIAAMTANLMRPEFVSVDAVGNIHVFDRGTGRVRKIDPDGLISTAVMVDPTKVTAHFVSAAGVHYFARKPDDLHDARGYHIVTVSPTGEHSVLRGASQLGGTVIAIAEGPDGDLYWAQEHAPCGYTPYMTQVIRLRSDGTRVTVVGMAPVDCSAFPAFVSWAARAYADMPAYQQTGAVSDDGPVTYVRFGRISSIAVDGLGRIHLGHGEISGVNYVSVLGPDGMLRRLAGGWRFKIDSRSGDGMPKDVPIDRIVLRGDQIALDGVGGVYVAEGYASLYAWQNPGFASVGEPGSGHVRQIDGYTVQTVAGGGMTHGNGTSALQEYLSGTEPDAYWCWIGWEDCTAPPLSGRHLRIAAHPAGGFVVSDAVERRVIRFAPAGLGDGGATEYRMPSSGGDQVFVFSTSGRHLRSLHAQTGQPIHTFGYDAQGALVSVNTAGGNVTTIERNAAGDAIAIVAPDGQRTMLTVDGDGQLASVTDPIGNGHQMTYGSGGLLQTFRTPTGRIATMTYDARGRLIRDANGAGGSWDLTREELPAEVPADVDTAVRNSGYVTRQISALGRVHSQRVEFMGNGDLRRTRGTPDGAQVLTTIANDGSTITQDADGTVTTSTRRPHPRFGLYSPLMSRTTRLPSGLTMVRVDEATASSSDPNDFLSLTQETRTSRLNGKATVSLFTAIDRQTVTSLPSGRTVTSRVDAVGRLTYVATSGLAAVSYTYDPRGRLLGISQGGGADQRALTYTYGPDGFVDSVRDALDQTVLYQRDAAGRVRQTTLPDSRTVLTDYDGNSNLTLLTPPGRPGHAFTYNLLDLETAYAPPVVADVGSPTSTITYNADQQPTVWTRADGSQLSLAYEGATGHLRTLTPSAGSGASIDLSYREGTGQLQSVVTAVATQTYAYDGFLLTGEVLTGAVIGSVGFGYDADLRLTSVSVAGEAVTQTYDADGLLASVGGLSIARHAQHGLPIGTTLNGITTTAAYNSFGELVTFAATTPLGILYDLRLSYDKLGRVSGKVETIAGVSTQRGYDYDVAGRLAAVTSGPAQVASYGYDSNGNRMQIDATVVATVDAQDRLLTHGGASYAYSAAGQLLSKTQGAQVTTYGYDIYGNLLSVLLPGGDQIGYLVDGSQRRIGKRVNGTVVRRWVYQDALRVAAQVDASGAVVARYVYGERPNVPEYMIKGGVTYRLLTDHLGSVRLVVNSSTGAVAQYLDYDEWGQVISDSNPGFQPFGFAGGLYDADTGLVRFGARDYDAATGRWTAKDPIRFEGGDLNLYAYVGGNPISYVDPTGEFLVGAGVGAGLELGIQAFSNYRSGCDLLDPGNYNWGQVGVAAAVGAVAPGWLAVGKTSATSGKAIANLAEQLGRAQTSSRVAKIESRIAGRAMGVADVLIPQLGFQGVKAVASHVAGAQGSDCPCNK